MANGRRTVAEPGGERAEALARPASVKVDEHHHARDRRLPRLHRPVGALGEVGVAPDHAAQARIRCQEREPTLHGSEPYPARLLQ